MTELELLKEVLKLKKGSGKPHVDKVGTVTQKQLEEIKLPYNVMGAYGLNGKHYLVLNVSKKLIRIKQNKRLC